MSIRTELRYACGINREEFLTEGIRFFRNSKRIEKLITKFKASLQYAQDVETKRDILNYIRELERAKLDFESVEQEYAAGNKEDAMDTYKGLKIKFSKIVSEINKETVKKFIISAGLGVLLIATVSSIIPSGAPLVKTTSTTTLSGGFQAMPTSAGLSAQERSILAEIQKNNAALKSIRDQKKMLSLFEKNQALIARLAEQQQGLQGKLGGE